MFDGKHVQMRPEVGQQLGARVGRLADQSGRDRTRTPLSNSKADRVDAFERPLRGAAGSCASEALPARPRSCRTDQRVRDSVGRSSRGQIT